MMLEISDEELKPYKIKGNRISQQSIVGNYLRNEKKNNPASDAVITLADSKEWQETMTYRNRLVHEQPPTVRGLGVVYKRRIQWEPSQTGKGYTLQVGGCKPEYAVDDLIQFINPAMSKFIETFISVAEYYRNTAESYMQRWNDKASV